MFEEPDVTEEAQQFYAKTRDLTVSVITLRVPVCCSLHSLLSICVDVLLSGFEITTNEHISTFPIAVRFTNCNICRYEDG